MSDPREDRPLDIRDGKLHVAYGSSIEMQRYRILCLEQGIVGTIVEDGVEYPMNEYAVFRPGPEPRTFSDDGRLTSKILGLQSAKRKALLEARKLAAA